jgi:hypothetical protein
LSTKLWRFSEGKVRRWVPGLSAWKFTLHSIANVLIAAQAASEGVSGVQKEAGGNSYHWTAG